MTTTINASTSAGLVSTADTSGILALQTADTTAITINGSQNVGIGTSSPSTTLHVSSNNNPAMVINRIPVTGDPAISFQSTGTQVAKITGLYGDGLAFQTGTGSTERMRIDSSGNVGIGTSSPTSYGDANTKLAVVSNTSGTNDLNIRWGTNAVKGILYCNDVSGAGVGIGSTTSAYLGFLTGGSERARIDSSGNLLVGTTSQPVSGKVVSSFLSSSSQFGAVFIDSQSNNTAIFAQFRNASTAIGSITNNNNTATAYNTSSDYRLKEDIAPMTGALAKVSALKPCTYKWKSNGSDGHGFIAHELAEVEPGCVTGEKDAVDADGNPVYQGIDTSFLVATLTAAIQEQQALITTLTERITALEAK